MKILSLDSTALVASVALCEDENRLAEVTLNNGNTHSETLLPTIEFLLRRFELAVDDIDLFAVAKGPGSFTGVRIGVATIKGLAFGTNKPCIGVSTLEALAEQLSGFDGLICPVMNARRKQVYTALFRSESGTLTQLLPDSAIALSELDAYLSKYREPVRLTGDGYEITKEALTSSLLPTPVQLRDQSAYAVAQVARRLYLSGTQTKDLDLAPTYLRLSQAERERAERLGLDTGI